MYRTACIGNNGRPSIERVSVQIHDAPQEVSSYWDAQWLPVALHLRTSPQTPSRIEGDGSHSRGSNVRLYDSCDSATATSACERSAQRWHPAFYVNIDNGAAHRSDVAAEGLCAVHDALCATRVRPNWCQSGLYPMSVLKHAGSVRRFVIICVMLAGRSSICTSRARQVTSLRSL